jgi:hypothetical protein
MMRSVGILLVALWLIVDIWFKILPSLNRYKVIAGWATTNALLIGVMGMMWFWLNDKLATQRDEVFQHLTVQHTSGFPAEDIYATTFVIKNDSPNKISNKHVLACFINAIVGDDGKNAAISHWQIPPTHKFPLGGMIMDGRDPAISDPGEEIWNDAFLADPIESGGDAETDRNCFGNITLKNTQCVDVTVAFWYALETQPDWRQEKKFRYVGITNGGTFTWQQQPISSSRQYCRQYFKPS